MFGAGRPRGHIAWRRLAFPPPRTWLGGLSAALMLCMVGVSGGASAASTTGIQRQNACRAVIGGGGLLNLEPLALMNGNPRYEAGFGGWTFTYNPCISYNVPLDPHEGQGDGCHFVSVCKFGSGEHLGIEITDDSVTNKRLTQNLTIATTDPLLKSNRTKSENNDNVPSEQKGADDDNDDTDDEDDDDDEEEEEDENDEDDDDDDNDADDDNSDKIKEKDTEDKGKENKVQDEVDNLPKQRTKRQSAAKSDEAVMNYYSIGIQRSAQFIIIQREEQEEEQEEEEEEEEGVPDVGSERNLSYDATITYTGVRSAWNFTSEVHLVCDWNRTGELDGLFFVTKLTPKSAHFELHHVCCCANGCPDSNMYHKRLPHMFSYNFSANGSAEAGEEYIYGYVSSPSPKFIWVILLVNFGLLTIAVVIGTICCKKGKGNAPYVNMLPALNTSQLSLTELVTGAPFLQRNSEKLDYSYAAEKKKMVPLLENCMIPAVVLDIGQRLGGGLFGDTYKATWNGKKVAVKRFTVGVHQTQLSEVDQIWLADEIAEMGKQRHQNLVSLFGVCFETKQPYLVNEYVTETTVKDVLNTVSGDFTWMQIFKISSQVAEGMAYLHSAKTPIIHRDLRCSNLLIDEKDRVKISDFGVMKLVQRLRQQCHNEGCFCQKEFSAVPASVRWTAPEILSNPETDEGSGIITSKCDVYSFGMVMFELVTRLDPFDQFQSESEVSEMVTEGYRPALPQDVDLLPNLPILIQHCWDEDSMVRPSFKQLILEIKDLTQVSRSLEKQFRKENRFTVGASHVVDIPT